MGFELYTEAEAAAKLKVSQKTLQAWRYDGKPPLFRKLGGAVRYAAEDLQEFVDAARRKSTSDAGTTQEDVA